MKYLKFENPVFKKGINIATAKGIHILDTEIGDEFGVKATKSNKVICRISVIGKAYVPFKMIPKQWLANEHDPKCRTLKKLFKYGLKPLHPDLTKEDHVTVLLFEIK